MLCSSTAPAILPEIAPTSAITVPIACTAATVSLVASCISVYLRSAISSVAFAVWPARLFTSEATTAKPLPASPARAASMVAFNANRFVFPAMSPISLNTASILLAAAANACTVLLVRWTSATA